MKKIMFLIVMSLVVLLSVPVVSAAFSCGSGTCKSSESCCDSSTCCPAGKNLYCSSSNTCYSSISAAKADCGDSYTICASPAEGKRQEFIIEPVGMCPKKEKSINETVTIKSKQIIYTESTSENTRNCPVVFMLAGENNIVLAANCIDQGLTCVLNGTPCCGIYECKGKFPNTTCQ